MSDASRTARREPHVSQRMEKSFSDTAWIGDSFRSLQCVFRLDSKASGGRASERKHGDVRLGLLHSRRRLGKRRGQLVAARLYGGAGRNE